MTGNQQAPTPPATPISADAGHISRLRAEKEVKMSDLDKLSWADRRGWARAEEEVQRTQMKGNSMSRQKSGIGIVFWMLVIGVVLVGVFTYLPGNLDPAYGNNGQVVNMVQPQGNNPDVDQQYSKVNQGNAQANLTNSRAYQRRATVWFVPMLCLMGFGVVAMVFKWFTQDNNA